MLCQTLFEQTLEKPSFTEENYSRAKRASLGPGSPTQTAMTFFILFDLNISNKSSPSACGLEL
jgi:hypothetical protein